MIWILLGWLGQALFGVRAVYQWIASERAGRTIVPRGYWKISLVASLLVMAYSVKLVNMVFALGIMPGAVIAVRNMRIARPAKRVTLIPFAVALGLLFVWTALQDRNVGTPVWRAVGLAGAILWGVRHVVQWWISERTGRSVLPAPFFVFSLAGGGMLLAYAISRSDPIMIAGFGLGCVPYIRNLLLIRSHRLATANTEPD